MFTTYFFFISRIILVNFEEFHHGERNLKIKTVQPIVIKRITLTYMKQTALMVN